MTKFKFKFKFCFVSIFVVRLYFVKNVYMYPIKCIMCRILERIVVIVKYVTNVILEYEKLLTFFLNKSDKFQGIEMRNT